MKRRAKIIPFPETAAVTRWFLDCDHDCHDYLVPVARRAEWQQWIDESANECAEPPSYAVRVDCINTVEFSHPTECGVPVVERRSKSGPKPKGDAA